MPVWVIVLLVILAVLLVAFIALMIFGNKLRKKQESQQAQIDAAKQVMSMLVIDKKKMKLKDAGLPKMVLDQTPKYLRGCQLLRRRLGQEL
jgi:Na+-transporting NADH:ubiquinone oxidoreductase subunit NqrC